MEIVLLSGFTQLLQDILGGLFDSILTPVLRDVFSILVNFIGNLISDILSNFLLRLWIIFLKLVAFMEGIFNVFSGISNVKVSDVSEDIDISLLEYFFRLEQVQRAFLVITAVSVVLAFFATLIGVVKSMSDMVLENRNPLSYVLKQAVKAAVSFLIIPMTCLFALQMSEIAVTRINKYVNYGTENSTVSDMLFYTVAAPAAKNAKTAQDYMAGQRYENAEQVKKDFDISKISYVQAYVSALLVALIMLCSILQFIQRIITILLLYVVSPFFVAFMPLDGGAKFREWKNMFGAHMLSAFGPILSMKIYLMLVPAVAGSDSQFQFGGVSPTVEAWIKLIFMIGGAFAVYKSRLLMISVIDPASAGAMAESGIIGAIVGGKALGKLKGSVGKKTGGGKSKSSGSSAQYTTKSQAYSGK